MKIKNLIIVLLCLSVLLVGCKNDQGGNENTNPQNATDPSDTGSVGENLSPSAPIYNFEDIEEIKIDKYIWEKEQIEFEQNCVQLTSDWQNSIHVGDATISASKYTDVSILPNYFINADNAAEIETAYNVQKKGFELRRDGIQFGDYIKGSLSVIATTWGKNLIIEEVQYIVNANPYAGGLDDLKSNARYDGAVGAGSTYAEVTKILGKPTSEETIPMMEGFEQVCVVYDTDNVNLTLIFIKDVSKNKDDGMLTTIYWRADALRETINTEIN